MNIAVPGMAEAGYGQTMSLLKPTSESKQVFEPAARHNNVLIELGQAGIPQRIREFAAKGPNLLAFPGAKRGFDEERLLGSKQTLQVAQFAAHGTGLAVQFDDQMGAAA